MKCVLLSVKPKWVAKILNGEKTIEIRKKFPKDYVGWVYVYCTKEQGLARLCNGSWNDTFVCEKNITDNEFKRMYSGYDGKGKVVARFWCDRVDEFYDFDDDLCKQACLDRGEMLDYLGNKNGYAIHITNLEIFDKPKEISEFVPYNIKQDHYKPFPTCDFRLTRAPQSYCFIEI